MPRIRTIKPEFWTDEKLSLLDPITRLVFLGLVSLADDYGRLLDNVKMLDGQIFPHTDDTVADCLGTLAQLSRVLRYTSASGQNLLQIVGWKAHQKVDHPGKEILPAPTKEDWLQPVTGQRPIAPPRKASRKPRETDATPSRSDLGPRTSTNDPSADGGNWVSEGAVLWGDAVAPIEPGRFGKALKPMVAKYGWPDTRLALLFYIEDTDGKTRRIEWFVGDAVRCIRLGKMKLMDDTGGLTERGELARRHIARSA